MTIANGQIYNKFESSSGKHLLVIIKDVEMALKLHDLEAVGQHSEAPSSLFPHAFCSFSNNQVSSETKEGEMRRP